MKDKQLVCLQIHNDYQVAGGETKTAHLIADLLEKNGIKVIRYYKSNAEYAGTTGLYKIVFGMRALNNPITSKELSQILDQNHVDFALVHNVVSVISNAAYKVLIKREIPIVKYIQNYNLICLNGSLDHDESCQICRHCNVVGVKCRCYKNSAIYSFIKLLIKRDMDTHILSHISAYMSNSKYVRDKHIEYGIDAGKIHVMYNYIDVPIIDNDGKFGYYLYYGRLAQEKGVMTAISAFSELESVRLVIMGSGPLEVDIKARIEQECLNNVEFIGSRQGSELLRIVANAKAVIVPSEWDEPLPRTILEAYSQGTPVIGSDSGGIPEMIETGITGVLFKKGNVKELVKAIDYIEMLNWKEYMQLRRMCIDKLEKEYTDIAYYNRFIDIIKVIKKR